MAQNTMGDRPTITVIHFPIPKEIMEGRKELPVPTNFEIQKNKIH